MNKYVSRVTSSARGELFNPLLWPFLLSTFVYGVGFIVISIMGDTQVYSSLYTSLTLLHAGIPLVWGIVAVAIILLGLSFLLFNLPPVGKASGLAGFALWAFASISYVYTGNWLLLFAIAIPNTWFWFWQYFSLARYGREDARDVKYMDNYNTGGYDDELNPKFARRDRRLNRGQDKQ